MSCIKCNLKVNRDSPKVKCDRCANIFHLPCVFLNEQDLESIVVLKKMWICPMCVQKERNTRTDNYSTVSSPTVNALPNTTASQSVPDSVIIKKVYDEILVMRNESNCNHVNIIKRIEALEKTLDKINDLYHENKLLKEELQKVQIKVDSLEQLQLQNSIDIVGVHAMKNEHINNVVIGVIKTGMNVDINESDIDFAYRKIKNNGVHTDIIQVRFVRRHMKNIVLEAKRKNKLLLAEKCGLNGNKIYINESLTYSKRQLYAAAIKAKNDNGYKYLWIRNSKILMKKIDGDRTVVISNINDLQTL